MFEKEAEEYAEKTSSLAIKKFNPLEPKLLSIGFQDGAEFGYNKAKEEMQGQEFNLRYENGIYKYKDKSGKEFESTDGKTWKEIVFPELKESE